MTPKKEKSLHKRLFSFSKIEVQHFFSNCKPLLKNHFVTVLKQPAPEGNLAKMLVIANRKVGKAHQRNRLRRLCKAIFLEQQLENSTCNIVLILRQKCLVDRPELELLFQSIKQKLSKA